MSLPREPRQLMINLMYIVLMAILALNVSAEILNAFLSMDRSITESQALVGRSNASLLESIRQQADAYPQFAAEAADAQRIQQYTAAFCTYLEAMKTQLIEATGGRDENQELKGKTDKNTTTRLLVDEGLGRQLRDSVLQLREGLLALLPDTSLRSQLAAKLPLKIDAIPPDSDKKDWADYHFRQLPLAAVLPLLSKFQSDARLSETALLNHLAAKISAQPIHDEYAAIVAADKNYVIRGEELRAEIFLGAYSSTTDNISVRVNGRPLTVRNGKAIYQRRTDELGSHDLAVEVSARDPRSGAVKTYRQRLRYEVGERSVTTAADKMNVFYLGVDNPLSVSAAGVPSDEVRVRAEGADLERQANGQYIVRPRATGETRIVVTGGGLDPTTFRYRVKPIPTPIAKLGDKTTGNLSPNAFKIYERIYPHLENFDFDAHCAIQGFLLTRVKRNGDVFDAQNRGGNFGERTRRLVDQAQRGDTYYFDRVRAKCPGDQYARKLNGLVFKIQ